jgi:hypothetical protein
MMVVRVSFACAIRDLLVAVVLIALGAGVGAAPAGAMTLETNCATLQEAIDKVAAGARHGEGEVIVLNGLCEATNLKSSSGVTLPAGSNFSIEGKPGTTSGFDGAGVNGPLLGTVGSEEADAAGAMTLNDLTFEHAHLTGASALSIRASRVTLSDDSFLENEEQGDTAHAAFVYVGQSQAHCPSATGPPAITLTGSTFSSNKLDLESNEGGGAGAWLQDACELSQNVLEGNTFEGNTLEASDAAEETQVTGAGLQFVGGKTQPAPVSQSANVFDSNRIVATPAFGNYGGGGEWLEDASLMSVGDRFSRNTIAGTSSPLNSRWSWGAGLGVFNLPCSGEDLTESTLEDAVVTGNAIDAGAGADLVDLGGGGVWVGCSHFRVLDSTVTLNSAPYGAGIEGEPGDQLEIANSIVAEDSGGNEIAGFNEAGGSLTASFSDICVYTDSSLPLHGAGNICADPLLANDGDPSSVDVHETASSPTIDAGSNGLVPTGLSTDFYGNPRVLSARYYTPACIPPATVMPTLYPPVVDMGASEFGPIAVPTFVVECVVTPEPGTQPTAQLGTQPIVQAGVQASVSSNPSVFSFPSLAQRPSGLLTLTFKGLAAGRLRVRGTFNLATSIVAIVKGRRRRTSKVETVAYGQAVRADTSPGNVTLQLKPTKQALVALVRHKRLKVRLSITFTTEGAAPLTREKTITLIYSAPAKKRS